MRRRYRPAPVSVVQPDTCRPGTRVTIGGVQGHVTANQIRQASDGTLYVSGVEVAWWDGRTRSQAWFEPWELEPVLTPGPIGFQQ